MATGLLQLYCGRLITLLVWNSVSDMDTSLYLHDINWLHRQVLPAGQLNEQHCMLCSDSHELSSCFQEAWYVPQSGQTKPIAGGRLVEKLRNTWRNLKEAGAVVKNEKENGLINFEPCTLGNKYIMCWIYRNYAKLLHFHHVVCMYWDGKLSIISCNMFCYQCKATMEEKITMEKLPQLCLKHVY